MSWTNFDLVEILAIGDEFGVFARQDIESGRVIGVFDGVVDVFRVDTEGMVDWRGQDGGMSIHLKLSDNTLYAIMPSPHIPISGIDFINHSCKPNCRADAGVLVVETTTAVAKGEQLTLNYHQMDLIKLGRPCWCEDVTVENRCIL